MLVTCEACESSYDVDEALFAGLPRGLPVQCTHCQHTFTVQVPGVVASAVPSPAPKSVRLYRRDDVQIFPRSVPLPAPATSDRGNHQTIRFGARGSGATSEAPKASASPAERWRAGLVIDPNGSSSLPMPLPPGADLGELPGPRHPGSGEPPRDAATWALVPSSPEPLPSGDFPPSIPVWPPWPGTRAPPVSDTLPHFRGPRSVFPLEPSPEVFKPRVVTMYGTSRTSTDEVLRACVGLPAPFLKIHDVTEQPGGREFLVVSDRFVGVSAARAALSLAAVGRRLPLDVWLGVADQLLRAVEGLPATHPLWRGWRGPLAFGVDLDEESSVFVTEWGTPVPCDAMLATFSREPGDLDFEWRDPAHPGGSPSYSVSRALIWLLDPTPLTWLRRDSQRAGGPAPLPWSRTWSHPEVSVALAQALNAGLEGRDPEGLVGLRARLLDRVGVAPAPAARIAAVFFGACAEYLHALVKHLAAEPQFLPERWRDGALLIRADEISERAIPPDQCPRDPNAMAVESPTGEALTPLTSTQTLKLFVSSNSPVGWQVTRQSVVGRALGFRHRVLHGGDGPLPAGTPLRVTVSHPVQVSVSVALEAQADGKGYAVVQPMAEALDVRLRYLLSSLTVEQPPKAFVPSFSPRPPPVDEAAHAEAVAQEEARQEAARFASSLPLRWWARVLRNLGLNVTGDDT